MSGSIDVSILILFHNNVGMSLKCLATVATATSGINCEIVILDNNSSEDTAPLREYGSAFKRFVWIRNGENSSFSIGNNLCARQASGRNLLFLNNDVFLRPESLQCLLAPLITDHRTGATGGKLLYPGEVAVQHAGIGQMLWDHPSNYGVGANPSDARIQEMCERFALSGAMLCVRRKVFESVGGFDERYLWGTEDIDLCLKIRSAGHKVTYCPDAVAVHCESATLKTNKASDADGNCRLYRQLWNPVLIPAERKYVRSLKRQGIGCVAVFGMGTAARGLARILNENGIQIAAFTSSSVGSAGEQYLGRRVVPLNLLRNEKYDRLMVASQYFFEIESAIRDYDPIGDPIYPLLELAPAEIPG